MTLFWILDEFLTFFIDYEGEEKRPEPEHQELDQENGREEEDMEEGRMRVIMMMTRRRRRIKNQSCPNLYRFTRGTWLSVF